MSHFLRRIIFWSFFVLFVILTSYFYLKLNGYVVTWDSLKSPSRFGVLQRTGILSVSSTPRNAEIVVEKRFKSLLGSRKTGKKMITPYKVKNLAPGEYFVTVELDGYWPFEKKVMIRPGETVYLENLILLKNTLPVMIRSADVQGIRTNSSGDYLFFEEDKAVFDIARETDVDVGEKIEFFHFLDNDSWLVNNSQIISSKNKSKVGVGDLSVNNKSSIKGKKNSNSFYYLDDLNNLQIYDADSGDNSLLIADKNIVDYYFKGSYLYLVVNENNYNSLEIYSAKDLKKITYVDLPFSGDAQFLFFKSNLTFVLDSNYRTLYIIAPFSPFSPIRAQVKNVNDIHFVDDNSFVYFSDFEIRLFNLSLMQDSLVARLENEVKSMVWHPRAYLVFSDGKSIKTIDFKYDYYLTKLFDFDAVSNLKLDRKANSLLFTAKIANREGLYKLFIQ